MRLVFSDGVKLLLVSQHDAKISFNWTVAVGISEKLHQYRISTNVPVAVRLFNTHTHHIFNTYTYCTKFRER